MGQGDQRSHSMEGKSRGETRSCLQLVSGGGQREERMRLRSSKDINPTEPPERNVGLRGWWWEGRVRMLVFNLSLIHLVI